MNKFESATRVIDQAISLGVSSVEMFKACRSTDKNEGAIKGYLVSHIIKNHFDEELKLYLWNTMGYDPNFHRMQVDYQGNISF